MIHCYGKVCNAHYILYTIFVCLKLDIHWYILCIHPNHILNKLKGKDNSFCLSNWSLDPSHIGHRTEHQSRHCRLEDRVDILHWLCFINSIQWCTMYNLKSDQTHSVWMYNLSILLGTLCMIYRKSQKLAGRASKWLMFGMKHNFGCMEDSYRRKLCRIHSCTYYSFQSISHRSSTWSHINWLCSRRQRRVLGIGFLLTYIIIEWSNFDSILTSSIIIIWMSKPSQGITLARTIKWIEKTGTSPWS